MFSLLIKLRHWSFLLVVAALGLLIWQDKHVRYDQSIESFFEPSDPEVERYQRSESRFGGDHFLFVVYDDPHLFEPEGMNRVAELADLIGPKSLASVINVQGLDSMPPFWLIDETLVSAGRSPAFARELLLRGMKSGLKAASANTIRSMILQTEGKDREAIRAATIAHPLPRGTAVSADGKTASLMVRLKPPREADLNEAIQEIRRRADDFAARHGLGRIAVVGPPVLLADGFLAIEKDGRNLARLGMILIAAVMVIAVRNVWWAVVPLLAGWTVWLTADAVMAELGTKVVLSGGPLAAQAIILAMPASGNLAVYFYNNRHLFPNRQAAMRHVLGIVSVPILWCAASNALGYYVLLTSELVPIRQFGAILGTAAIAASLVVLALAPWAMDPPIRLEAPAPPRRGRAWFTRRIQRLINAVSRHAWLVLTLSGLTAALVMAGAVRLEYESNYINMFRPQARVAQDFRFVEERLGGIGLFEITVPLGPGDELKAEDLTRLASLDQQIRRIGVQEDWPALQVLSLAAMIDPERKLRSLPSSSRQRIIDAKVEFIDVYSRINDPDALSLLDPFWKRRGQDEGESGDRQNYARILIRLAESQENEIKQETFRLAREAAEQIFPDARIELTGLSYLLTRANYAVTATQWKTSTLSAIGVWILLALAIFTTQSRAGTRRRGWRRWAVMILESVGLSMIAALPTLLSVGLTLGLMGWLGIKLDIATALVASVAFGLAVDHTFHCLIQYRRKRRTLGFARSLVLGYGISGPGVVLSTLAISAGFFALWFSEYVPFAYFGLLIAIATTGSMIGNLIFLPACLALGEALRQRGEPSRGKATEDGEETRA